MDFFVVFSSMSRVYFRYPIHTLGSFRLIIVLFVQALIHLAEANLDGNAYWYPLKTHDENGEPLAPPTPNQSPQSSFRSKGHRVPGDTGESSDSYTAKKDRK